jgi:hypothetical protein
MSPAPRPTGSTSDEAKTAATGAIFRLPGWTGWLAAAVIALGAALLVQLFLGARGELVAVREEAALSRVEAQSTLNLLEAERLLSQRQIAELRNAHERLAALERSSDPVYLKIHTLSSQLENAPEAQGAAVWSTEKQSGSLVISSLPPAPAGRTYRLWIIDPEYPDPVDAGAVKVGDAPGGTRYDFRVARTVRTAEKLRVTLESRDGVTTPEGPTVLSTP